MRPSPEAIRRALARETPDPKALTGRERARVVAEQVCAAYPSPLPPDELAEVVYSFHGMPIVGDVLDVILHVANPYYEPLPFAVASAILREASR